MVTIRDVARAAGVSIATVSRVFNGSSRVSEETRRTVRQAATKLDYWPNSAARSLTTSRSQVLGILLPDLFGEFFSEVIRGIDHSARREKLQILVSSSHADTDALLAAARSMRGRIDGLIAMAPDKGSAKAIHQITRKFPVVLLSPRFAFNGCCTVSMANYDGARAMADHLIKLGHRDVAMVTGPSGNVDAEERLRGFRDALADAGFDPHSSLEIAGDFTESSGYRAAIKVLRRRPRPTAVFAANDYMAIGLLSALRDAGVEVPGDVAVTGFDDIAIAQYLNPPLTTVHVDAYELGGRAVRIWLESARMPAPAPPSREVIPATLVVRDSCGSTQPRTAEERARRRWGVSFAQPVSDAGPPAAPRSRKSARVTSRTRGRVLGGR